MTMGLEPMKLQDWIEVDSVYEEEMNMRRDVLRDKRHLVIAQKPGVCLVLLLSPRTLRLILPASISMYALLAQRKPASHTVFTEPR